MRPEVTALFRELADRSPEEREEYYVREGVAAALREEIESLLQYDRADDSLRGYVDSAQREFVDQTVSHTHEETVRPAPRRVSVVVPDLIGRFAITKLLGRGGMGEVYLARDPIIDRMVAIKVIGSGFEDESGRHRLLREARAAGRLHHSNIVSVFEAGEYDTRLFIAMEYVPGETLGSMIRRRASVTLRRRIEMIESACAGLAHAHRAGVVHLDIKPDNLMLDEAGVVKVLDFGISRVLHNETRATAHGAGTLRYMSPEQVQGNLLDHRSDVFSLGCSLFELVTYAPAFNGSTQQIVTQIALGPIPSLLTVSPEIDPRLDQIIRRAMALEPSKRYDDLEQMRAELAQVRAGIDPASDAAHVSSLQPALPAGLGSESNAVITPSVRTSRRAGAWTSRAAIAVGAAVIVLVAALVLFYRGGSLSTDRGNGVTPPTASPAAPSNEPTVAVEKPKPAQPQDDVGRQSARGDRAAVVDQLGKKSVAPAPANPVTAAPADTQAPAERRAGAADLPAGNAPPPPVVNETPPTPPAAAAAAPAPEPAVTPTPRPPEAPSDSASIAAALRRYDAAYQSLDVGAVLKVYPSLGRDQVEQLRRTFAGVTGYEMQTQITRLEVKNDTAIVLARVARRMAPRVGNPVANEFDTEFQLRRSGSDWVIVSVRAK